jgi:hypothetical protein
VNKFPIEIITLGRIIRTKSIGIKVPIKPTSITSCIPKIQKGPSPMIVSNFKVK